jgi:hypothetical protein
MEVTLFIWSYVVLSGHEKSSLNTGTLNRGFTVLTGKCEIL